MDKKVVEEEIWHVLKEKCEAIKYGEWEIRLYIHKGQCVGFDQIKEPLIKFRVSSNKTI